MDCSSVSWRRHALERMFTRNISRDTVKNVISIGKIIEIYNNNQPFPSQLLFAMINKEAIHVVVAKDENTDECYVVTAYIPSEEYFENDFITRRES